jgi:hypothetical protein
MEPEGSLPYSQVQLQMIYMWAWNSAAQQLLQVLTGNAQVCLDRISLSYWYLSCDKRLTHRTFVTSSYKLKNMYNKTM